MHKSNHVFSLSKTPPQFANEFGTRTSVNRPSFPVLNGMALYRLVLQPGGFREPQYSPEDIVIGGFQGKLDIPWTAGFSNHYKLAVESLPPLLATDFGSARTARRQFWPVLEGLSMYSLRLLGTGMREPHWHPQTAEMGYVLQGNARMTLLSPKANVDTYLLGPGDMYFIPKGYPHHIENLTDEEMHFLIFFDKTTPEDIGFTGALAAFPRRIAGPTLGCTEETLPRIPAYPADLLVVEKINPPLA